MAEEPQATQAPETVQINDLNNFVTLLSGWHGNKVAMLKHMQQIPEGTTMQVGENGPEVVLAGDMLTGFKAGIDLALMELGELPFLVEMEDAANEPTSQPG